MKIKNNFILVFCVIGLLVGGFDGFMAYDEEIKMILDYKTDYENVKFWFLVFRYFKWCLLIYFFSFGRLSKFFTATTVMVKSYFYSFTLCLIFISFDGLTLFSRYLMVIVQMTLSFVLTIVFAQIMMNCNENIYDYEKSTLIGFLAFVFSLICCIIIALIDLMIIKLVF